MSENNSQPLANINALSELDKLRFRALAMDVREARRRAEDLLAKIASMKDTFLAQEMEKAKEEVETVEEAPLLNEPEVVEEPTAPAQPQEEEVVAPTVSEQPIQKEEVVAVEPVSQPDPVEKKAEEPAPSPAPNTPTRNPLRPDVPEPRKFTPTKVYIPEADKYPSRGGRAPYVGGSTGGRPYQPNINGGFGFRDADKPMFVPPQNGTRKGGKKNYEKGANYTDEKKGPNKKDLMRRELSSGMEVDDAELARRYKSKKYQKQAPVVSQNVIEKAVITVDPVPIKLLSEKIGKTGAEIMKLLLMEGVMKTINDSIDFSMAELVAANFGIELELKADKSAEEKLEEFIIDSTEANTERRAPIVTIMGHVDHGKTSLLDYIRNSKVAEGEAGGITQHIGAYTIEKNGQMITFIDTPGHEAFTAMRARGAMVTDIAIIVVAADDGIMPQTIEAINHAKAANVPIIVAINKIDVKGADVNRVKQELLQYDVVVTDFGGKVEACPVSAKTGEGVENLLDTINFCVEADIQPMANSKIPARGTVVEAKVDRAGPLATILVQNGTLKVGDYMVAGSTYGKVKSMTNDKGKLVKTAGPSMPVAVLGFDETPSAGDQMVVLGDEKLARKIAEERKVKMKESETSNNRKNVEDLFAQINEGKLKTLNLIIKADVQGSLEALVQEINKLGNDEVNVKVIHKGVGNVNDSDVILAKTSNAMIICFNLRKDDNFDGAASKQGVIIKRFTIIYELLNAIELALKGMIAPVFRESVIGKAEVREVFKISGVGLIAGCRVMEGKLQRNAKARVIRDGVVLADSTMSSLKHLKDDVKEVQTGFECGVGIADYSDIKAGDVIECYLIEEVTEE